MWLLGSAAYSDATKHPEAPRESARVALVPWARGFQGETMALCGRWRTGTPPADRCARAVGVGVLPPGRDHRCSGEHTYHPSFRSEEQCGYGILMVSS